MDPIRDEHTRTMETLLVAVTRLVRIAAGDAGNATSPAVWRTLGILDSEGTLRLGELARASRVAQPTMTKLVASMVDDGLVTRATDPADSRVGLITITDAGRTAIATWRVTLASRLGPMFADLDQDEWTTLAAAATLLSSRVRTETSA